MRPPLLTEASMIFVERLGKIIINTLRRSPDGVQTVSIHPLLGEIAQRAFHGLRQLNHASDPEAARAQLNAEFVRYYFQLTKKNRHILGRSLLPLCGAEMDATLFAQEFGVELPVPDGPASLATAVEMAQWNVARAREAIGALWFLGDLARGCGDGSAAVNACINEAGDGLFAKLMHFEYNLLQLTVLQGNASAIDKLRRRIVEEDFGHGRDIMGLLSPGGCFGRYLAEDETALRADMEKAAGQPIR